MLKDLYICLSSDLIQYMSAWIWISKVFLSNLKVVLSHKNCCHHTSHCSGISGVEAYFLWKLKNRMTYLKKKSQFWNGNFFLYNHQICQLPLFSCLPLFLTMFASFVDKHQSIKLVMFKYIPLTYCLPKVYTIYEPRFTKLAWFNKKKNKQNKNFVFLFYPFFFLSHMLMEVGEQFVISESHILCIRLLSKILFNNFNIKTKQ